MTNTVGLQVRYDDIDTVALYKTQGRQIYDTTREDTVGELSAGLYFQNAVQWNSWFRSVLGLRWDYYDFDVNSSIPENSGSADDSLVSPKLSLIFGPWAKTEYFVNAGYGFHSNDARGTTLHVDPNDPAAIVDPVDPLVQTKGGELGVRTEIIPNLQSSLSLWMLEQDSEILFVGDAGTSEASRPSKRQGVEWINYWRPLPWMLVNFELAFTKARFTDDDPAGDYIPGALGSMGTLGLTVDNYRNWFGTVQVNYFGVRPLIEDNSVQSSTTTITNARLGYQISKNFRVQLDVFNLFDAKQSDIEYFYESFVPQFDSAPGERIHFHPTEPRQFRLSVIATF
jgi:outer membrane receptor protein involved in Fe transport